MVAASRRGSTCTGGCAGCTRRVERHERGRADHVNGTARAEYDQVHRYATYRTEVDTAVLDVFEQWRTVALGGRVMARERARHAP
jgi:chloramphenicol 3-O-phosphotransferase